MYLKNIWLLISIINYSLFNKKLVKDDFKYFSQEFDSKVLDLDKQKEFYPYEYMNGFENFKEELLSKEKFYSLFASTQTSDKDYGRVLKVWNRFKMKEMKHHHDLYLKCDVLLLADVFKKSRSSSLTSCGLCPNHCLTAPVEMQCLRLQNLSLKLFQMQKYICSLRKFWEVEFLIFLRDSKANNNYLKYLDQKQVSN